MSATPDVPVPRILHCPSCRHRHIDEGEWATRPHCKHLCLVCGHIWQPAPTPTVGVARLPGRRRAPAIVDIPMTGVVPPVRVFWRARGRLRSTTVDRPAIADKVFNRSMLVDPRYMPGVVPRVWVYEGMSLVVLETPMGLLYTPIVGWTDASGKFDGRVPRAARPRPRVESAGG